MSTTHIIAMQLLSQTRSVPVFSLVVRNCCLLFHAARHLLKLQFEVTSLVKEVVTDFAIGYRCF